MNKINVLDCTLRDGGYINQWQFGNKNIKKIITKLVEANIDIIECGFLTEKNEYNNECSLFDTVTRVKEFLPDDRGKNLFLCMINFGAYDLRNLPAYDGTSIDGIRVAFHKKDKEKALIFCEGIAKKGYKLFMQPMVSIAYKDEEFLDLIRKANQIHPYAFYIVDSFGVMKRKDLMRLYYLVDHNIDKNIYVGYHSHNNIQMAYSNAQALVDLTTKRDLIIDSSVFGMGRGAGNLNTELFIEYVNEIKGTKYMSKPLLQIIDQILGPVYLKNYWGYSLPHYVSAKHNCHPNYASYLDNKSTLTIENINEIMSSMNEGKKNNFDKDYIENLYNHYQARLVADENARNELSKIFKGKTALLIAPGSSIDTESDKILNAISEPDTITVSINFKSDKYSCDYIFVSNLRRYDSLEKKKGVEFIATSNIKNGNINVIWHF
jgi:4-hydroxy 2-oxovalerate aldolase